MSLSLSLSLSVATLFALAPPAHAAKKVRILRAWIAAGAKGQPASTREVRVKRGTDVRLYAVVEAIVDGKRRTFSRAKDLRRGRRKVKGVKAWPRALGALKLTWYKLEADPISDGIYDNTGTMERGWHPEARKSHPERWHWCSIDYVETKTKWGNVWSHRADAKPTTTPNYGGLGTMRFVLRVEHRGKVVFTRGRAHKDRSGLKRGIATVRFRRDDSSVGYMTELMNVPYVFGSSSTSGRARDHQTERAVGADCADLVVYGWRRQGRKKQKYTWTGGLKSLSRRRARVSDLVANRYRTADGRPIKFGRDIQAGDMLLWSGHVAVISAKDPTGYLTPETEILHTVIEVPALVPLKQIGFSFDQPPFDIRRARWEKTRKPGAQVKRSRKTRTRRAKKRRRRSK